MAAKKWYESKTIWGIVLAFVLSIANIFGVMPEALPESLQKVIEMLALAFAFYGRIVAKKPVEL